MTNKRLVICVNERLGIGQKSCAGSGSKGLASKIQKIFDDKSMSVEIVEQVCLGRCEEGIAMRIAPGGPFFTRVSEQDLVDIAEAVDKFKPSSN